MVLPSHVWRMTPGQKRQVWDSLLDSDMNSRYWRYIARRYHYLEMALKILLLCISSGTVLAWIIWLNIQWLWKLLSVIAFVISGTLLVLNLPARTEAMVDLTGKWTALMNSYERLWDSLPTSTVETALARYDDLKATQVELTRFEGRLPNSKRLIRRAYNEVCASRGLVARQ